MKIKLPFANSVLIFVTEMILVTSLLLTTAGCGSTKVSTYSNTNASVGQQLMDLQKAHDQGLINDKDYEKLRKDIIKKNE